MSRDYDEILSARPAVATSPTPEEALARFVGALTSEQLQIVRDLVVPPPRAERLRDEVIRDIERLDVGDLRTMALVLRELPYARLVATCEGITDRGIEGRARVELPPTTAREAALGALLRAWDAWAALAGAPPRVPRGTGAPLLGSRGKVSADDGRGRQT